tara:strand:- start:280 stop:549 length:270 start_codon:yes stop_codon:yes gene_type:complete
MPLAENVSPYLVLLSPTEVEQGGTLMLTRLLVGEETLPLVLDLRLRLVLPLIIVQRRTLGYLVDYLPFSHVLPPLPDDLHSGQNHLVRE